MKDKSDLFMAIERMTLSEGHLRLTPSQVLALRKEFKRLQTAVKRLEKERDELLEVLAPFAFHGRAWNVEKQKNILKPISKKGVSALCVGAFQSAIELYRKHHPHWRRD